VHEYSRRTLAEEPVADLYPVDRDLSGLHVIRVAADIRSANSLSSRPMAENAEAENAHAISRVADSGEDAIRNLVALPLRILAGTLGIFEALLRTAADTIRDMDPADERIAELERRLDSLEEQTTGRRESARSTSAARKRTRTAGAAAEPERSGPDEPAVGSDTAAGPGGA
jgi:chloramphenicol 3-O-phosphotransferase